MNAVIMLHPMLSSFTAQSISNLQSTSSSSLLLLTSTFESITIISISISLSSSLSRELHRARLESWELLWYVALLCHLSCCPGCSDIYLSTVCVHGYSPAPTRHFVVLRRVWFLIIKYICFEAYPLLAPKCRVGAGVKAHGNRQYPWTDKSCVQPRYQYVLLTSIYTVHLVAMYVVDGQDCVSSGKRRYNTIGMYGTIPVDRLSGPTIHGHTVLYHTVPYIFILCIVCTYIQSSYHTKP